MNSWKLDFYTKFVSYIDDDRLDGYVDCDPRHLINFIENLLEEAKKEERDRLGELLFSKIIWTDDIAKIFKN